MGDNNAAQLHAEAFWENCALAHWGPDGLKPYMRYTLAGGYQSNGENGIGLDYCIQPEGGYAAINSIKENIRQAMEAWMNSPGHRRNILHKTHKRVNIGLTWDTYNVNMNQHFEGDYIEFTSLPALAGGVLSMSGTTKNGALFGPDNWFGVDVHYDPPPRPLSPGQLSRVYCYEYGMPVAFLWKPPPAGSVYSEDTIPAEYGGCPDPYDVPSDAPAPTSYEEALTFAQKARDASQSSATSTVSVPGIIASRWKTDGTELSVEADVSEVLQTHGPGVYTVMIWGHIDGERDVISMYSIFHDIPRPTRYD